MNHLLLLPLLLPLAAGLVLLAAARRPLAWQRAVGLAACLGQLAAAIALLSLAVDGTIHGYLVGEWPARVGIALVLDRLSALMLLITALLALPALVYASGGADGRGRHFHALFQFQLFGLNGAFLTGDLFNLFVFFEVLLIASYGLLLHGGGAPRTRAGLHYVVLNLAGSSLFLIAVGTLYGVAGTLNLADLALKLRALPATELPLARAGGLLLLTVFALKAALLPLHFWLVPAYGAATAPVAALFAVMTKVGVYAIVRVFSLAFGPEAGPLAGLALPWLMPAALATIALGAVGAAAARDLRAVAGYLVLVSVGTLLAGVGLGTPAALGGALYYLIHTTLVSGGLFLLADLIAARRPQHALLVAGVRPARARLLGTLYLAAAVALVGLPPLSGLIGKLLILKAAIGSPWLGWVWGVVLAASLALLAVLTRAGSLLFWRGRPAPPPEAGLRPSALAACTALIGMSPLLVLLGGPVAAYAAATAEQIHTPGLYLRAVAALAPRSPTIPEASP